MRSSIKKLRAAVDELARINDIATADSRGSPTIVHDEKEAYYLSVAFFELAAHGNNEAARPLLEQADSAWERVESQLRPGSPSTVPLLAAMAEFRRAAGEVLPAPPIGLAPAQLVEVRDGEYHLLCSVCGMDCAALGPDKAGRLRYKGITDADSLEPADMVELAPLLDGGNLRRAHEYLATKYRDYDMKGIDVYCPDCDLTYCREHYDVIERWDEGFYDDAVGTCPRGHRRILDD